MRIILHPEGHSTLGDDNFWPWFKREFPEAVWECDEKEDDVVLQYAVLGPHHGPARTIALLWEMYPEMQAVLEPKHESWLQKFDAMNACAAQASHLVIPTEHSHAYWPGADILPIGVDTQTFCPIGMQAVFRKKYGFPEKGRIGFWSGTNHPMKGFDRLKESIGLADHWVVVWKHRDEADHLIGNYNATGITQSTISELMNCCDFFLSTGRLTPMFMVEWEAMAAGLPLVSAPGVKREMPEGSARDAVFDLGWDRRSTKSKWIEYLNELR